MDAKIVHALQADGRLANTEVARRLGVAEGTVRKRIDRLLREGVMQVGAWADPLRIGYQTYAMIQIEVEPPHIERVAERLAQVPEVFLVGICTGAFDIYAAALFRSNEHLYEFVVKRLTRIAGIVRTSTSNTIRIVKREYAYPVPGVPVERNGPRGRVARVGHPGPIPLDPLDRALISLLQVDGRLPNTEIARRLGVAEATVRKRIERLVEDRVMQVGAWVDPLRIGYQTYAIIEGQVKPPDVEKVAERLAKLPEIFFLGICTGAFDIYAAALFRSNEHIYEFMVKRLPLVPGLLRTTMSSVVRLVKREYRYPVPGASETSVREANGFGARRRILRHA